MLTNQLFGLWYQVTYIEKDILTFFDNELDEVDNFSHKLKLLKRIWTDSNSKPSTPIKQFIEIYKTPFQ